MIQITSKLVKFIKEYDSSNGGNRCMMSIGGFLEVSTEIPDPKETQIFRCYDKDKNLLGEIRPKLGDKLFDIIF